MKIMVILRYQLKTIAVNSYFPYLKLAKFLINAADWISYTIKTESWEFPLQRRCFSWHWISPIVCSLVSTSSTCFGYHLWHISELLRLDKWSWYHMKNVTRSPPGLFGELLHVIFNGLKKKKMCCFIFKTILRS